MTFKPEYTNWDSNFLELLNLNKNGKYYKNFIINRIFNEKFNYTTKKRYYHNVYMLNDRLAEYIRNNCNNVWYIPSHITKSKMYNMLSYFQTSCVSDLQVLEIEDYGEKIDEIEII